MCVLQEIMIHRNQNILQKLSWFNKIQLTQGRTERRARAAVLRHVISHFFLGECPLPSQNPSRNFSLLLKKPEETFVLSRNSRFSGFLPNWNFKVSVVHLQGTSELEPIRSSLDWYFKAEKSHNHLPESEGQHVQCDFKMFACSCLFEYYIRACPKMLTLLLFHFLFFFFLSLFGTSVCQNSINININITPILLTVSKPPPSFEGEYCLVFNLTHKNSQMTTSTINQHKAIYNVHIFNWQFTQNRKY